MKPLADFVCNSKKCRTRQGAPVFELPINATHCPMGHKQIVRLFNKVNVRIGQAKPDFPDMRHTSSSKAARIDVIAEPTMLQAEANANRMKEAQRRYPGARMVPTGRIGQALGEVYGGMTRGVPTVSVDPPSKKAVKGGELGGVIQEMAAQTQGQVPTAIRAVDREFKVVRESDGSLSADKA